MFLGVKVIDVKKYYCFQIFWVHTSCQKIVKFSMKNLTEKFQVTDLQFGKVTHLYFILA